MAKDAILQVRMDAELKEKVEQLYRSMGTSFSEIVRVLAMQSLIENGVPFRITVKRGQSFRALSDLANPDLKMKEEGAFERAMIENHANE